jgi:hypothetical protein
MTKPATHALRYRIWAYADPRGWDCTIPEIAEALDVPMRRVQKIAVDAGWSGRLRGVSDGDAETLWGRRAYFHTGGAARHIAADILAGRVGMAE